MHEAKQAFRVSPVPCLQIHEGIRCISGPWLSVVLSTVWLLSSLRVVFGRDHISDTADPELAPQVIRLLSSKCRFKQKSAKRLLPRPRDGLCFWVTI